MRTFAPLLATLLAMFVAWSLIAEADAPQDAVMAAWEYQVLSPSDLAGIEQVPLSELRDPQARKQREAAALNHLNQLGAQGWELIEIENDHYYLKRAAVER